jgi:hypothetical protein
MAFFASAPERAVVGPGICRVTYGGFLLSFPPGRLADVWTDADYRFAESKRRRCFWRRSTTRANGRRLRRSQAPAVDLPPDRGPPRPEILHLPLGTLSPTTLRRSAVMHVLAGHGKREIARITSGSCSKSVRAVR